MEDFIGRFEAAILKIKALSSVSVKSTVRQRISGEGDSLFGGGWNRVKPDLEVVSDNGEVWLDFKLGSSTIILSKQLSLPEAEFVLEKLCQLPAKRQEMLQTLEVLAS